MGVGVYEDACVEDRRVRFPAVAALARARVAPCATGARQSADCLRPRSPRRPRVRASAAPFVSGNRPHFHGDWSRPSVPRARPGHRRACAFRRRTPGLRLRGGCGAMLSSRAAPPAHPPRHASVGGVRAPSRSSRTVRSTAPRLSADSITMHLCNYVAEKNCSPNGKNQCLRLFRTRFSSRRGDRVDAAVLRLHRKEDRRWCL